MRVSRHLVQQYGPRSEQKRSCAVCERTSLNRTSFDRIDSAVCPLGFPQPGLSCPCLLRLLKVMIEHVLDLLFRKHSVRLLGSLTCYDYISNNIKANTTEILK